MAEQGFSVGTATGGGTFRTENSSGTLTPVGLTAWGGAGTVTRVGSSMGAALPVGIYGGTFNAGTVTVANTGTVVGTVAVSNTGTVVGTVATSNAGTVAMLQAGSVQVTAGTMTGTVAVSTIAAGTVVATAAGTQLVSGTVNTGNAGTLAMLQAGTITTIQGGTVVATAAGTQTVAGTVSQAGTALANPTVGQGKTLAYGTINLTSGSVSLVNPGSGTTAYIVGITLTVGTAGIIQFLRGAGAAALSGPIHVDQYGGFVDRGQPSAPILKSAAGSQIYLSITSGIGTAGGYYSYFTEA